MKFVREELSGAGKTRYSFALGKEEMKIIDGLLNNALRYTPDTHENMIQRLRMGQMKKVLVEALKETPEDK